jgi:hypothetical protein
MRHSVSREEDMERKQHHTSADHRLSRASLGVRIEAVWCFCNGGAKFETLWRILLHGQQRLDRCRS